MFSEGSQQRKSAIGLEGLVLSCQSLAEKCHGGDVGRGSVA